jgi:hypothetical protein
MPGVTGVELIKGSQLLRDQPGTSVGTLVSPGDSSSEATSEDQDASTPTTTERPTTAPADDENGSGRPADGTQVARPPPARSFPTHHHVNAEPGCEQSGEAKHLASDPGDAIYASTPAPDKP